MVFARVVAGLASAAVVGVAALSASPLPAFGSTDIGNLKYAGERKGATRLKFEAGDSVQTQVDVATGNLLVSVKGLALVGAKTKITTGAFYNSLAFNSISASTRLGRGWGLDYTPSINIKTNTDGSVTYTGASGLTGVFDLKTNSTTKYDAPTGFTVDLEKTGSGWTMTDHSSNAKEKFNTAGELLSREDRNNNKTTIAANGTAGGFTNYAITAPAGPTNARVITVATDAAGKTTTSQVSGSGTRTSSFTRTSGQMASFTDALARVTSFGYNGAGLLSSISASGSRRTSFAYDSSNRVTSITQLEDATGGPGSSITRLAYVSGTETDVANPNTDQGLAVTAVPHVEYSDIDSNERVGHVEDEEHRKQDKTYNPVGMTLNTTNGSGSNEESVTQNTYGSNKESMLKSSTTAGQEMSQSYPATSGPEQYQPTGGKDSGGVSTTYEYNGAGNAIAAQGQSGARASLDYNTNNDGTVVAAASPISDTNKTLYEYTNKQQTKITPKTGSTLGIQNLTYDDYGRTKTATDGRGITVTYGYDNLDRMTSTTFSDGMSVTYGYDTAGRMATRTDPNGTTTYGFDQLSRMTTRKNTFGSAETFNYKYNKAGWLIQTSSTTAGVVTYAYDNSGKAIDITYPFSTANPTPKRIHMHYDDKGRRDEVYSGANTTDLTTYMAHMKYVYNKDNKVVGIDAWQGSGDANNTQIINIDYCYKPLWDATFQVGVKPGNSCTSSETPKLPQSGKLVWQKDKMTGQVTRYTYKSDGQLDKVYDVKDATDRDQDVQLYDYDYDKNGNRKAADHLTNGTLDLTFNPENQITNAGYTYDAAGNPTARPAANGLPAVSNLTYTAAEQPKSVVTANSGGTATTYNYKHAGADSNELLQETTPDGTYTFNYGRPGQTKVPTIETISLSGVGTASVLNDPSTGQPLMLRSSSGLQATYIYDGTPGSPIALVTSGGYQAFAAQYDPYGLQTITAGSPGSFETRQNPFTFAGGIQDRATKFVHYGQRYYDPATGTWTQRDTLDAPLSPNDANRYAYAGGDPINKTDPTGKFSWCQLAVAGLAIGIVTTTASFIGLVAAEGVAAGVSGGSSALAIGPTILLGLEVTGTLISYAGVFGSC